MISIDQFPECVIQANSITSYLLALSVSVVTFARYKKTKNCKISSASITHSNTEVNIETNQNLCMSVISTFLN